MALAALMGAVAVATAPEKTQVQVALESNQTELDATRPAADPSASGKGAAGPASSAPAPGSPAPAQSSGAAAEPGWYVPTGQQLSVYGDSLVVASLHGFEATFPGVAIEARSNRKWSEGLAVVRSQVQAGQARDSVVIALGTNAGVSDTSIVREALDLLGPDRQIVLVNLYGRSSWIEAANETLQGVADDYPNVTVADWHSLASDQPGLLQSDGVHPGIDGANAYAHLVKETFAEKAGQKQ